MSDSVIIASRFCGPPTSGNGGYCSGVLARQLEGTARVTLRKPIPLDKSLAIERSSPDSARLLDGETVIAEAERAELNLEMPALPSLAEVEAAAALYPGLRTHAFPTCFVCGPKNEYGLRIFSGPVAGRDQVAAPWSPDASLADGDGTVAPEFVWAALDCPGYWAAMRGAPARMALLGQFTVQIERPILAGERYIVAGWPISRSDRKHRVGTALFSLSGNLLAAALAIWIEVQPPA